MYLKVSQITSLWSLYNRYKNYFYDNTKHEEIIYRFASISRKDSSYFKFTLKYISLRKTKLIN